MQNVNPNEALPALGPVVIRLMRGVVYRDQHVKVWDDLLELQAQVMDYLEVIGLALELDEAEGYAFLVQKSGGDDTPILPRLIQRRPLSYPVSLLCVLLRKKLVEADAGGSDLRVVLTRDEMVEMLRLFLPEEANEARFVDRIDTHINKVVALGFLKALSKEKQVYEIRRIIKALVDADWLANLDQLLKEYENHARRS